MNEGLSSPSGEASAPRADAPEIDATIVVTSDGLVQEASAAAAAWWELTPETLSGRPFAGLFFFEAPAGSVDPVQEAWKLLQAATSARALTLQARVEGGGFEARVSLERETSRVDGGYRARIRRTDTTRASASPEPDEDLEITSKATGAAAARETPSMAADESRPDALSPAEEASDTGLELPDEEADEVSEAQDVQSDVSDDESWEDDVEGEGVAGLEDSGAAASSAWLEHDSSVFNWRAWDGAAAGFFELDFLHGHARYSESWCRLLGYEPEDVAGEPDTLGSLFHPDDSEAAPGAAWARGGVRMPYSAEARLRANDGSWRWMQFEGVQTFGPDGELEHVLGVMLDIQERRDLEDEMGRGEERFRQLTAAAHHVFFELDLAEDAGVFSSEFRHLLGYSARELPATPDGFLRLLPAEDAEPGLEAYFSAVLRAGAGLTRRIQLCHRDGRILDCEAMLSPQYNRRGELQRITGVVALADSRESLDEPTGRSSAESTAVATGSATERLAEAARLALDAVGEAVVLTDETGCVSHANVRALQWAGGDPARVIGQSFQQIFVLVDRANHLPAPEVLRRVLEGGQSLELDHRYALIDAAGDQADAVITCRAVYNVRKRVSGAIVILRKPAEMPLTPAELVASNRMETLGRLACGIAHDFNNLLTTVTGSLSLATDRRDWDALAPAQKALGTARNLARQLLTYARGDTAEKKVQSINEVIKETARLTSAGSKSTVTLELGADVHPVNLDSVRLVQVFTNLILNAMQVMPAGGKIWVRTQNMRLGQVNSVALAAGEYVRVEVQDNGPGIPAENLEHIFEPFFSTRSGGTGLGLAMVRSIVTQHEGAIEVASTVGSGTTFTLYFPRASAEQSKETPKPMAVTHGSGRILIMDDDPDLCQVAKGMLEVLGYDADVATSGDAAIAAVRKYREMGRRYSAVILDLTMAGGPGGEDVLPRLREIDPEIVAIVSSGYVTEDQLEKFRQLGFKGMLAKPYRSAELGRALKEVLSAGK